MFSQFVEDGSQFSQLTVLELKIEDRLKCLLDKKLTVKKSLFEDL